MTSILTATSSEPSNEAWQRRASLENHLSVGTRRIRLGAKHADVNGIRDREPQILVLHAPRWIEVHPCANWLVLVLFLLFLLLLVVG